MTRQEQEFLRDKYFVEESKNMVKYIEEVIAANQDIFTAEFEHVFKHYEQSGEELSEKAIKGNVVVNLFYLVKIICDRAFDECAKKAKNVYRVSDDGGI